MHSDKKGTFNKLIKDDLVPRVANSEIHILGEGPIWDANSNELHWVDIKRALVFTGQLSTDQKITITNRQRFDETVGAVASSLNHLKIVANGEVLRIFKDDIEIDSIQLFESNGTRRLNDGKPDPHGRYLVGSLAFDGKSKSEQLFLIDNDRKIKVIDSDLTLSNGLAWNSAGNKFYSIDTFSKKIFVRDYDLDTGNCGPRSTFAVIKEGYPDGMCMDSENCLWVAIWGNGEVLRFNEAGEISNRIKVPAPNTTSVCFAGKNLDVMVITTASDELSPEQIAQYPNSGSIFTLVPGVTGLPQSLWGGFTK